MLLTDWNMEDALRVREEEGIQIGEQRGMRRGEQRAKQQIFAALQQQGYDINLIKSKLPREFA